MEFFFVCLVSLSKLTNSSSDVQLLGKINIYNSVTNDNL
jgi:hypothetical protein